MSQMVTRKGASSDEKEKRQTDSPVKDMKKKMAANAEKEKQAAEKSTEKPAEKSDKQKPAEKPAEKSDKQKPAEKPADKTDKQKSAEKPAEKSDKQKPAEQPAEKSDKQKPAEKPNQQKPAEKPNQQKPAEKAAEKQNDKQSEKDKKSDKAENGVDKKSDKKPEQKDNKDAEKNGDKGEKSGKLQEKKPPNTPKQNGSKVHNGVTDVVLSSNGTDETLNGATVSEEEDQDLIDDGLQDELFPELAYDDSDPEFDPATPDGPSRSYTRRSQVKATRTPETPRPASDKDKQTDAKEDESKILKMTEVPTSTDRKLRSSDSPKPDSKKKDEKENGDKDGEVIDLDAEEEPRKTDTNFSKSRVKVSPYRRSLRKTAQADQTQTSVMANYTGNNTTMEMDITETSSFMSEDPSMDLNESSYLNGLRTIRGRPSYKPLKEIPIRKIDRSLRSTASLNASDTSRPTLPVVGRKRKPDPSADLSIDSAIEAQETRIETKRMRLFERIAMPFRRTVASTPLPSRRAAEIVGLNSDLPMTAPVSSPETFDPESLKPSISIEPPTPHPAGHAPAQATPTIAEGGDASKRCIVM